MSSTAWIPDGTGAAQSAMERLVGDNHPEEAVALAEQLRDMPGATARKTISDMLLLAALVSRARMRAPERARELLADAVFFNPTSARASRLHLLALAGSGSPAALAEARRYLSLVDDIEYREFATRLLPGRWIPVSPKVASDTSDASARSAVSAPCAESPEPAPAVATTPGKVMEATMRCLSAVIVVETSVLPPPDPYAALSEELARIVSAYRPGLDRRADLTLVCFAGRCGSVTALPDAVAEGRRPPVVADLAAARDHWVAPSDDALAPVLDAVGKTLALSRTAALAPELWLVALTAPHSRTATVSDALRSFRLPLRLASAVVSDRHDAAGPFDAMARRQPMVVAAAQIPVFWRQLETAWTRTPAIRAPKPPVDPA
jgi:hypothetical protein